MERVLSQMKVSGLGFIKHFYSLTFHTNFAASGHHTWAEAARLLPAAQGAKFLWLHPSLSVCSFLQNWEIPQPGKSIAQMCLSYHFLVAVLNQWVLGIGEQHPSPPASRETILSDMDDDNQSMPTVIISSAMYPLLAFPPSICHYSCSLTPASWNYLPRKTSFRQKKSQGDRNDKRGRRTKKVCNMESQGGGSFKKERVNLSQQQLGWASVLEQHWSQSQFPDLAAEEPLKHPQPPPVWGRWILWWTSPGM
ncbi:uncharacterized protein LOC117979163 isoform X2 [Pan paniscus]|uniref:uncharacterized protein LOC117979163 isoform X2 n=1 Tax=Pan paniscus TaxID=9597 RepID=UPI0024367F4D|nr:uncharacterized protein LOC117979163 isoform X2 [Pan paniscus]XP_054964324.1 uncharacterized protein LOC117979163 isoform X2 [Pan paniscus]